MSQRPIGIATWNYREETLAERIERFARMGYSAVSLAESDARALASGAAPEVEDAILSNSLAVAIHGAITSGSEEQTLADFEAYMRWHDRTGVLRTVNYDPCCVEMPGGVRDYDSDHMRAILAKLLAASRGSGITVGVEDWPRSTAHLALVGDLPEHPHYGVLIDLGHLNMRIRKGHDVDAASFADAASEYLAGFTLPINELHVHNNNGTRDEHAPPNAGTADLTALAAILRQMDVRGPSTIEIVPEWAGLTEQQGIQAAADAVGFWRQAFDPGDD